MNSRIEKLADDLRSLLRGCTATRLTDAERQSLLELCLTLRSTVPPAGRDDFERAFDADWRKVFFPKPQGRL